MERTYINATNNARAAVATIMGLVRSGKVQPRIGFDVETAPIPGLEGYPGTEFVYDEESGDERRVKATKQTYLKFAQKLWKGAITPTGLRLLGLYIPEKTTSGKVGELTAQEAWRLFHARLEELFSTEGGRSAIEVHRWQLEGLEAVIGKLDSEMVTIQHQLDELASLSGREWGTTKEAKAEAKAAVAAMPADLAAYFGQSYTVKAGERAIKKLTERVAELQAERDFLDTYARERTEKPVDLRLLMHVVRVGVEGRVHLNASGSNRLDPVQPGLDPYTSTIFLVQVTLVDEAGVKQSWIFNTNEDKVELSVLRPLLQMKGVRYEGQNIKFDLKMAMHHIGTAPKNVHCTFISDRVMHLGLMMKRGLGHLTQRYLGLDINKAMQTSFVGRRIAEPAPEQLEYAYTDTEVLPPLVDAQIARSERFGQRSLIDVFSRLSWMAAKWELDGYRIDTEKWLEIAAGAAVNRDRVARELELMLLGTAYTDAFGAVVAQEAEDEGEAGDEDREEDPRADAALKMTQNKAVADAAQKLLGVPFQAKNKGGAVSLSAGKDARAAAEREYRRIHSGKGHPFFKQYALWSKLSKQTSTYGKKFLWAIHPLTGRIHPTFHIAGTDTARFSSTGPNWLNIPAAKEEGDPDFRGAIISDEGRYFLGADYDAMEFRIAGDVARDEVILGMVEAGVDAHTFTAANMYHIVPADVQEPTVADSFYRRGASEIPIRVFQVPRSWTTQDIIELAVKPEVAEVIAAVPEKITRSDAKTVTFRWQFRGGAWGLAEKTGLPVDTCEEMMGRFVKVYKTTDDYLNWLGETAVTENVIENGNRRYGFTVGYNGIRRYAELPHAPWRSDFRDWSSYEVAAKDYKRRIRSIQRELCNLPMQGGNAVISAEAILLAVELGEEWGVYPKFLIYDEMIVEAPDHTPPTVTKDIIETAMLTPARKYMTYVPAGATAELKKAGKYWRKS